jgi:hypothetical protein
VRVPAELAHARPSSHSPLVSPEAPAKPSLAASTQGLPAELPELPLETAPGQAAAPPGRARNAAGALSHSALRRGRIARPATAPPQDKR